MDPSGRISFDRIAHRYDDTRNLPEEQMEAVLDVLVEELTGAAPVLEVGVGTGRFGVPLQKQGVPLVGVDLAPRMLRRGLRKGLANVLLGDALHLPFRDRAFDAALSIHVLHLMPDWRGALAEIGRVTHGDYHTVASYWDREHPTPHRVYWDYLREAGYDRLRPGLFERELPEEIPPRRRRPVGTFALTRDVDDMVGRLADRVYSTQWRLPDEVHEAAMTAVLSQFAGGSLTVERRIEILVWDAAALTEG